ncbi:hypothetical protein C8J57DRAFT_1641075 [Mycena rebaudengoi]|nr:hypothetical protein C8J57DRAFT_1641075 [Mycena rebaudengoi]
MPPSDITTSSSALFLPACWDSWPIWPPGGRLYRSLLPVWLGGGLTQASRAPNSPPLNENGAIHNSTPAPAVSGTGDERLVPPPVLVLVPCTACAHLNSKDPNLAHQFSDPDASFRHTVVHAPRWKGARRATGTLRMPRIGLDASKIALRTAKELSRRGGGGREAKNRKKGGRHGNDGPLERGDLDASERRRQAVEHIMRCLTQDYDAVKEKEKKSEKTNKKNPGLRDEYCHAKQWP